MGEGYRRLASNLKRNALLAATHREGIGLPLATLDAGGMGERKAKFEPYSGDFAHVPPPYCYRCPFGLSYPSCGLACVKAMETAILGEGPETVAEVIVEPVMSGVGVAVPPDEYLPEVESLCRKYGILLHVDRSEERRVGKEWRSR